MTFYKYFNLIFRTVLEWAEIFVEGQDFCCTSFPVDCRIYESTIVHKLELLGFREEEKGTCLMYDFPPIYLYLIFIILQFGISSLMKNCRFLEDIIYGRPSPVHVHLKMDNVDYLKKPSWNFICFAYFCNPLIKSTWKMLSNACKTFLAIISGLST